MSRDTLTEKQDKKYEHFSTNDFIRDIEHKGTDAEPDFWRGSKVASDRGRFDEGLGRGQAEIDNDVLRQGEEEGSFIKKIDPPVMHKGKPARRWQLLTNGKVRNKASLLTVIALLFGGGGFLTVLFAPASAIVQLKEVLTQSLNDQVKAMDSRSASIMRAKFKSTTTGSCGVVKIKCALGEMSDEEVKNFQERNPHITIDRENIVDGQGKISKLTFDPGDGSKPLEITDANQFSDALRDNEGFRAAWSTEYNPTFEGFSDPKAREVFAHDKLSKNYAIDGQNDEERQKKLNEIAGGQDDLGSKSLTKQTDKDGKETYVDDSGHTYTKEQADDINKITDNEELLHKAGGVAGVLKTAEKAVAVDGVVENYCTTWNFMRHVSTAAKTAKKLQLIRYALALVLTPADKIKANDATEDATNYSNNVISKSQPDSKIIDDSKLGNTWTGSAPLTPDSDTGKNGFDAPGYKQEESGIAEKLNSRASKFSLTSSSAGIIDTVQSTVAKAVSGGNPDPKVISQKCGYVQNSLVRIGAFAAGIAAGVGTLGVATAVQAGLSVAWSLSQPLLEASLGDMMNGDVTKDIYGLDSVDATRVGVASMASDIAQYRGMPPVTSQEGVDYINQNRITVAQYNQSQTYLARTTPLDINNRYSFLGSMLFSMTPTIIQSRSNVSMAMINVMSFIPTTFAAISQPVKAADVNGSGNLSPEYFNSCPDPVYKSKDVHILADNFCVVRHWMPQSSLDLDPLENAQWMSDTGNIDPDSDTGEAKDNGQKWNYVKFMEECVNRTQPMGENQDENEGDGTNCYKPEYENLNMHFRTYTMDLSINAGMRDQRSSSTNTPTTTGGGDTAKHKAGPNGWVFPTVASDLIVRQFGKDGFTGVDLAGSSVALTNQQPIYAGKDGVVIAAGPGPNGYGNWIVIQHPADSTGKSYYTVYGNLDSDGILVSRNQQVKAGDQIGKIGSADTANGPHLRFEVWDGSPLAGGTAIDPTPIVEGARPQANTIGGN